MAPASRMTPAGSEGQVQDLVLEVHWCRHLSDVREILHGPPYTQSLRDLDHSGVVQPRADPLVRKAQHGVHVMGQENPPLASRPIEDLPIMRRLQTDGPDTHDVQVLQPAVESSYDRGVEVLVGDETKQRRGSV